MGLDQVPLVTQLLRACRDANDQLLKEVFRQILSNGISKEELNVSDKSGRVSSLQYSIISKNSRVMKFVKYFRLNCLYRKLISLPEIEIATRNWSK